MGTWERQKRMMRTRVVTVRKTERMRAPTREGEREGGAESRSLSPTSAAPDVTAVDADEIADGRELTAAPPRHPPSTATNPLRPSPRQRPHVPTPTRAAWLGGRNGGKGREGERKAS